jgi:hypothetical protein
MRVIVLLCFAATLLASAAASGVELKAVAVSPDGMTIVAGGEHG